MMPGDKLTPEEVEFMEARAAPLHWVILAFTVASIFTMLTFA